MKRLEKKILRIDEYFPGAKQLVKSNYFNSLEINKLITPKDIAYFKTENHYGIATKWIMTSWITGSKTEWYEWASLYYRELNQNKTNDKLTKLDLPQIKTKENYQNSKNKLDVLADDAYIEVHSLEDEIVLVSWINENRDEKFSSKLNLKTDYIL